jgi:hypothetical protein
MTSANVVEYRIEKDHESVGNFRKNMMCRLPEYSDLLKYQPLDEHTITPWGYDEEDEDCEDDTVNLEEFLRKMIPSNRLIREHFERNVSIKLNDNAIKKLEFISGAGFRRNFPESKPSLEWVGAVLDFLEEIGE